MEKATEEKMQTGSEKERERETVTLEGRSTDEPWEGCVNSVNYRIRRGAAVEVPRAVAELIRLNEAERRRSEALVARFAAGDGAKL